MIAIALSNVYAVYTQSIGTGNGVFDIKTRLNVKFSELAIVSILKYGGRNFFVYDELRTLHDVRRVVV